METSQTALCSHMHTIEQRLSRWLLNLTDRLDSDELQLTQAYIAKMLGIHRPCVTMAAIGLQNAGLIHYTRGRISIINRQGLEELTCECYEIIKKAIDLNSTFKYALRRLSLGQTGK